nr:hypothetical protein [Tanacetum cinerariifolium]
MTEANKLRYIANVKVMNYLLQAIPNDIYNLVDACQNAKDVWDKTRMLMYGSDFTKHVIHSRLVNEFNKFAAKEGESLESVYERLTTLMNVIDRNAVRPIQVSVNTKFLNSLQLEWSKYFIMIRQNQVNDGKEGESLESVYERLTTLMNVMDRNAVRPIQVSVNTKIYDTSGYVYERIVRVTVATAHGIVGEINTWIAFMIIIGKVAISCICLLALMGRIVDIEESGLGELRHRIKCFQRNLVMLEQMLLAMKNKAGANLKDDENDFMLDNANDCELLEELTVVVIMMAHIQPADDTAETEPKYET